MKALPLLPLLVLLFPVLLPRELHLPILFLPVDCSFLLVLRYSPIAPSSSSSLFPVMRLPCPSLPSVILHRPFLSIALHRSFLPRSSQRSSFQIQLLFTRTPPAPAGGVPVSSRLRLLCSQTRGGAPERVLRTSMFKIRCRPASLPWGCLGSVDCKTPSTFLVQ
jgi:hypothetical protein